MSGGYTYKVTTSAGVPLVAKPHPFFPTPGPIFDAAAEASDWPKSMLAPVIRQKLRDFARALIAAQEQRHD